MSLAVLYSRALSGMDAPEVIVEVHLANGLPSFTIVGLPEAEVKESKDRVRAALHHEKGSFTGALSQKIGNFEIADGGTIFLDEIANLPYDVQVSLLRVVQERKMRRVGGTKDIDLDVRIIVASNELLWDNTRQNKMRFREDLYHRFNEFTITVPPLRERKDDIHIFARHFLNLTNTELGKNVKGFTPEVDEIFRNYIWYGNLRELKNVIKRSVLLTDGDRVEARTLPFEISNFSKLQFEDAGTAPSREEEPEQSEEYSTPVPAAERTRETSLKSAGIDAEYELILSTLKKVKFNSKYNTKLTSC